jgi:DNA-binding beta-propeller fold protein YncE
LGPDALQKSQAWARELEKYPITAHAIKLNLDLSFPNEEAENNGIYLNRCSNFCITDDGFIYVANTGESSICKFDLKGSLVNRFGTRGQGPNDFLTPRSIDIDGLSRLWIDDKGNGRIKVVNEEGKFVSISKYFISANLIKVNKDSNEAYVHIRDMDPKNQLFHVMNERGEILRSFGNKKDFTNNTPFHNTVCFSIKRDGGLVVAAWKFFDTCRLYRDDGTQVSEFKVIHEAINKQTGLNLRSKPEDNSVTFRSLIEAVYAGEDSIYLLTCSPRMEILELDYSGNAKNIYRYDTQVEYVASDLYVFEEGGQKSFVVLQNVPAYKIDIFSIKTKQYD